MHHILCRYTNCMHSQNHTCPHLLFSLKTLSMTNLLKPGHKNYLWSRAGKNVYGLEEIRARVGRFDTPWENTPYLPVPDLDQSFSLTFSEIMDLRAHEIFTHAKQTGKRIVVLWSGGIDSTCILSAFIKNLSASDLHIITVCSNVAGVAENTYFYQAFIRGKLHMMHWRDLDVSDDFFRNNILIHGDPGDCIFGPSVGKYYSLLSNGSHTVPWKSNMAVLYALYHDPIAPEFAGWWVNKVCDNLAELQEQGLYTNVRSISDWHWWNYFNLKWHGSMTRALVNNKKNIKEKISRKYLQEFFDMTFFTHDNFQIWSYQNLHELLAQGVRGHKRHAKQYIYELDNNEVYLNNKKKEASTVPMYHGPLVIDSDAVHHSPNDEQISALMQQLLDQ